MPEVCPPTNSFLAQLTISQLSYSDGPLSVGCPSVCLSVRPSVRPLNWHVLKPLSLETSNWTPMEVHKKSPWKPEIRSLWPISSELWGSKVPPRIIENLIQKLQYLNNCCIDLHDFLHEYWSWSVTSFPADWWRHLYFSILYEFFLFFWDLQMNWSPVTL